jgi:hypothetical protein
MSGHLHRLGFPISPYSLFKDVSSSLRTFSCRHVDFSVVSMTYLVCVIHCRSASTFLKCPAVMAFACIDTGIPTFFFEFII